MLAAASDWRCRVPWPEEYPEPVRLEMLASLVGYDAAASRATGVMTSIDQRRFTGAEIMVMESASGLELHIASELQAAVAAADLHVLLRLAVGAPGNEQFIAALAALAKRGRQPAPGDLPHGELDRIRASQNAAVRSEFRATILPGLTGLALVGAKVILDRIDAAARTGPPPVRAEVVALLLDRDPSGKDDLHADGRPYTSAECQLFASATEKEWNDAISLKLAAAEIAGARAARYRRLDEILRSAPRAAQLDFDADMDRQVPPHPDMGEGPLTQLLRYQDQFDIAFANAFRRHVLPCLSPQIRSEAGALLTDLGHHEARD